MVRVEVDRGRICKDATMTRIESLSSQLVDARATEESTAIAFYSCAKRLRAAAFATHIGAVSRRRHIERRLAYRAKRGLVQ